MANQLHAFFAATLLCGTIGLAGPALAQSLGLPGNTNAPTAPAPVAPAGTPNIPQPGALPAPSQTLAPLPAPTTGVDAIDRNAPSARELLDRAAPGAQEDVPEAGAAAATPGAENGAEEELQANEPAPESTDEVATAPQGNGDGPFGLDLGDTSTEAAGLTGAERARVAQNERRITAELNRASAASTGNANPAIRAAGPEGTPNP